MKVFLVSNLYPSAKYPTFGTFVKEFEDSIVSQGALITCKAVIDKKYKWKISLLLAYILLYSKILFKGFFEKYDIIYVHYIAHPSLALYLLSLIKKVKIVLNVHGDDILPRTRLVNAFQPIIRSLLKKTALVVVPSLYFKDVFLERFLFDESRVFVYPSGGVNRTVFKTIKESKKILGFSEDDFLLGFVSRIEYGKGWELFIKSVSELNGLNKKVKGIMIGSGEEEESLKAFLHQNELSGIIHFMGKVHHKELALYYSAMNLFIFPSSLRESLGLVGIEAMACGTPVIGTDLAGIKTYVRNGYNGYLFPVNDKANLLDKVECYSRLSVDEKKEIRANCLNTALEYDSVESSKKLYVQLLELF